MILNSPYISGSLTVTGNTTIQGQLTVTGSLSGTASLASNALLLQGTGSTGFATTASLLQVSSSQQQISSSLLQVSASYTALSGSYNTFSGSASTRITVDSASLLAVSSSQQQISSSYISLSGSYNTFSGSASTRVTQIENTYATTGSNSFRANQSITGSLVVSSTITAQTLVVQTVTSSILYSSGSNVFGNQSTDRQTFTGSVNITGSLTVNTTGTEFQVTNNGVVMGNLLTDNHSVTGSLRVTGSTHSIFGNVGIGTITPDAKLHICNAVSGGTNNYSIIVQNSCTVSDSRAGIAFSNNSQTPSAGGLSGASIQTSNNGIDGAGNLLFSTLISGASCERIRITSGGNVGIGTNSPSYQLEIGGTGPTFSLAASGGSGYTEMYFSRSTNSVMGYIASGVNESVTGSGNAFVFDNRISGGNMVFRTNGGSGATERMRITSGGIACFSSTVCAPCFATISDYRMKSNIRPIAGLSIIMNTKPYKFEYNYDCSTSFGMIAHELQDILPEAVFGYKDGEVMQGVDYMKLLPITIKAIQEQQCKIALLESCLGIA